MRKKDKPKKPAKQRMRPLREAAEAEARRKLEEGPPPVVVELGEFRPYKASYHCKSVVELGKRGLSEAQIAVALGMSRQTLRRWRKSHDEFGEAMGVALTLAEAHWEQRWASRMDLYGHNANAYKHMMASRFRDTYGERVQLAGDEDAPLTMITRRVVDPKEE